MRRLFLIPGLGADYRIFKHLEFAGYDVVPIIWRTPEQTDTLATYAQKLIDHYHITEQCIIVGNSLGGMIAIEIAKIVAVKKTILISSIRTIDEAPAYFSVVRAVPFYKIIPGKLFTSIDFLVELIFGEMEKGDKKLFMDMLKKTPVTFLKWAMGAVLHWDNKVIPKNTYLVTGEKDLVLPSKKLKNATIVKNGTHIMIFDKAGEINKILKEILNK
jgi:pimeloyl-ACP methyl ester carboxylesterase